MPEIAMSNPAPTMTTLGFTAWLIFALFFGFISAWGGIKPFL
jgi:hypothetical protein